MVKGLDLSYVGSFAAASFLGCSFSSDSFFRLPLNPSLSLTSLLQPPSSSLYRILAICQTQSSTQIESGIGKGIATGIRTELLQSKSPRRRPQKRKIFLTYHASSSKLGPALLAPPALSPIPRPNLAVRRKPVHGLLKGTASLVTNALLHMFFLVRAWPWIGRTRRLLRLLPWAVALKGVGGSSRAGEVNARRLDNLRVVVVVPGTLY